MDVHDENGNIVGTNDLYYHRMAVSLTATVSAGGGAIQDSIADFSDTIEIRNFVVYDDNGNRVFGTLTSALGFTYPQAPFFRHR